MKRFLATTLLALAASCSPAHRHPRGASASAFTIVISSGDGQAGPVGQPCPLPLVVRVTDWLGAPAAGVEVAFEGPFRGEVSYAITDGLGIAWTPAVPPAIGSWQITAETWIGSSNAVPFTINGK